MNICRICRTGIIQNRVIQNKSNFRFGLNEHICFAEECFSALPPEADFGLCQTSRFFFKIK